MICPRGRYPSPSQWSTGHPIIATAQCTTVVALLVIVLAPSSAEASFGFRPGPEGFSTTSLMSDGTFALTAGSHPYALQMDSAFNTSAGTSDGDLRSLRITLPSGVLTNSAVVPKCPTEDFHQHRVSPFESSASGESCPDNSQVGVIGVDVGGSTRHFGLFNLESPFGAVVSLGASPFDTPLVFNVVFREGDDGLDLDVEELPQSFDLQSLEVTIWGTPWIRSSHVSFQEAHETERGNCLNEVDPAEFYGKRSTVVKIGSREEFVLGTCGIADPRLLTTAVKSYLTLPTTPCGTPPVFTAAATSWSGAQSTDTATIPALEKCNKPLTTPKLQLMTDNAAARTGLAFNLNVNDGGGILNPGGIARPALNTAGRVPPRRPDHQPLPRRRPRDLHGSRLRPRDFGLRTGCRLPQRLQDRHRRPRRRPRAGRTAPRLDLPRDPLPEPLRLPARRLHARAQSPSRPHRQVRGDASSPTPTPVSLVGTFEELPRLLYTHFNLTLREGQRSTFISPSDLRQLT